MKNSITTTPLVYKGEIIRDKGEMLSLTDMWIAGGRDDAKRPANWARKEGAPFIEAVSISLDVPVGHIYKSQRGGRGIGGETFAHWQVALAYAKYLNHDFHMWCNEVVRSHMEGRPHQAIATLPPEVLELIRSDQGISRMLAHKVTGIEATVQTLANVVSAIALIVQPNHPGIYVEGKTSGEIWAAHNLPPQIKNSAKWLGNRLAEMGCQIDDCRKVRLGMRGARLFDPDKAAICMKNGLVQKARQYAAERQGQTALRLVGGRAA